MHAIKAIIKHVRFCFSGSSSSSF